MSGWKRLGWTSEGYSPTWHYAAVAAVIGAIIFIVEAAP